jgi:predicted nucleotidyltransferase
MDGALVEAVARRHGIELLLQFGSTVTGKSHARSDLDLGVLLQRVPDSMPEYGALVSDLQSLVADRDVDIAIVNHADPLFLKRIIDGSRLIYGAQARLQELRIYAFKRYQDHRRFLDMEREYVRRAVAARL